MSAPIARATARSRRRIEAGTSPQKASAARAELLEQLAAEPARPALSRVVFVGAVRAVEFALLLATGSALYYVYVVRRVGPQAIYYPTLLCVAALAILAFQSSQGYGVSAFRRPIRSLFRMSGAWAAIFLGLSAVIFLLKLDERISRVWVVAWFALGFAALALERWALARFVGLLARTGRLQRRAVIVGGGELGRELARELAKADPADVRLIGVFDDRGDARSPDALDGAPKLGTVDDLVAFARATRIDVAIFALPISAEARILEMVRKLWVLPIDVRLAAHANRLRLQPRSYSYIGAAPMLDIIDKPLADWDVVVKLAFDRIVGALALVALLPVLLAAAIAIKLDSPGPILFRQTRYGFNNERIEVYKFRSLYVDMADPTASRLVTRNDPRVTRVGRILRKTSIDELPQLFNVVFKGNLSLVGPRPHVLYAKAANRSYEEAVDGYFARHRVKPGITGWAQVNGWRGETDTQEKLQQRVDHDLYYIENWSLALDLYILAVTPVALMNTRNAF